jgi:hypothetical protein
VEDRAGLQGIEEPAGSGRYPEPRWIAKIQHDKVLYDHGNPVSPPGLECRRGRGVPAELRAWEESAHLGIAMINANRMFATDYPAALSNAMSNTDSMPFMDHVAAVSVRENRRLYEIGWRGRRGTGRGARPALAPAHRPLVNYTDWDFLLGFNAMQMTPDRGTEGAAVRARIEPGEPRGAGSSPPPCRSPGVGW